MTYKDKASIKKYYEENKIKWKESRERNKEKIKERKRLYYENNKEKIIAKTKEYESNNKEAVLETKRSYRRNNREKFHTYYNEYNKERKSKDVEYKISCNLRNRLYLSLKCNNTRKNNKTMTYVGCTKEELKLHLEKQFTDGMSWENYGDWHIDHIFPLSKIDLSLEENIFKVMHFSNLQPLWAEDNISKGGSLSYNKL